jgi:hypothetical protein
VQTDANFRVPVNYPLSTGGAALRPLSAMSLALPQGVRYERTARVGLPFSMLRF